MHRNDGFTLVEIIIVIVVLGVLSAVAIPKFIEVRAEAEVAAVNNMVSSLESAMSIAASRAYIDGDAIAAHNPFDDLANVPKNYNGEQSAVNPANTPAGTWTYRTNGGWIMYNPQGSITGGWSSGGEQFIIYQVQDVVENGDVVGIRLVTTPAYEYTWN